MLTAKISKFDEFKPGLEPCGDDISKYISHLYYGDMEGYISLTRGFKHFEYLNFKNLGDISKYRGLRNVYITPNSFYIPKRGVTNIRHFRALYIDIDVDERFISKTEVVYKVFIMAEGGEIPRPTMIVDSGRGLHLYWRIEHAPYGALWSWQQVEDYLYSKLSKFGADRKAMDAARFLRLPCTINSRINRECKIIYLWNYTYLLSSIRDCFIQEVPKENRKGKLKSKTKTKNKIVNFYNSYTLHMARIRDIEKLCHLRNWDIKGYRNTVLHCWIYWTGIYIDDLDELIEKALDFNGKLIEPFSSKTVIEVVKSTRRAINAFLEYQEGRGKGNSVTKQIGANIGVPGYNYSNDRLIDELDISMKEQESLEVIISTKEKYRRNNKRRRKSRRNENGLTTREQQKKDNIDSVMELYNKGYKQKDIASKLCLSRATVSLIVNGKY